MPLADMLPTFEDAALLNLKSNATRLVAEPGARHEEAVALLPLIEAEIADRESKKQPKIVRRSRKTAASS